MLEKIKKLLSHPLVDQFRDVRAVGFAAFGIVVILVSWSGINVIQTNYELQKQISELRQQNEIAELENANIKLENQYFDTDAYLELAARRQFGKGLPGETLILVPKSVALSYTISPLADSEKEQIVAEQQTWYQNNLESWRNFFGL